MEFCLLGVVLLTTSQDLFYYVQGRGLVSAHIDKIIYIPRYSFSRVTLAQLVKASVGQADVQRFEPRLGHNWLSCGVFLVKSRHFGFPLAQTIRAKLAISLAGGSVAIQTWSIYKVYT